ncbi:tetratricopeptide repeat protein [Robiginitalea aurantiaca]|uniref:Tetratricopeptide repeat protein n=1 Tax=Robiginitalea aurantiaca TaxID=3056915 RepID=A0ABT7WHS5_9FLAO|nr:tetratricopeptide repeat protein [Robiginitalea aurantiaca]MDM9632477.1 tetratricopeptide repeat protein [Robiginitalea aurantiaca]
MKTKLLIMTALLIGLAGFSQKSEIKAAEKAMKSGDAAAAKASLESASGLIAGADERTQAQYYFLKGHAYADLARKGDMSAFGESVDAYKKVISLEESTGKAKYTAEASAQMSAVANDLVNAAVEDNKAKKYTDAADKLYMAYQLSPRDTIYLYYAASSAVNSGDYQMALDYYKELKDVGYDGSQMEYRATNVETGEVEVMQKTQRDLMVKSGTYSNPVDEKTESKRAEIVRNIALIYTQLGNNEEALDAYKEARADNPDDVNLVLNEANLYYQLGDKDKFKALMAEAARMAPDNPDLHYNIGVINMEQGDIEGARAAYRKAIEINPGYVNAQLNLSTTYVNEGNGLIDDMNALGTSRADLEQYDAYKSQKDELFKEGAKVLEDALKTNPDNEAVLSQLKNIYGALGDNENFMRIKKLLGE